MQPHQPNIGELFADRYQIEKELGSGGMGKVFLANDSLLEGTPVALKILSGSLSRDTAYSKQFLREIQVARQVTHPNIARTFEAGIVNGQLYFTMELVRGGELTQLLGRGGMPVNHALPMIQQICAGLAAIHEAGVVHGDLKPANLMLATDGRVKISDFGIARGAEMQQGRSEIVGSPQYMAPEIWRGDGASARSDLYALGIILYEIVTGRSPFEGANDASAMYHHLSTDPTPPIEVKSSIPEWLNKMIMDLLAKDYRYRLQSIDEVQKILDEAINGLKDETLSIIEIHHYSSTSSENLQLNAPDQESLDSLRQSMMYRTEDIEDLPFARIMSWWQTQNTQKLKAYALAFTEALVFFLAAGWTLLFPLAKAQEAALGAASRSNSSFAMFLAACFTLTGVAALVTTPFIFGRCFLPRLHAAALWAGAIVGTTMLTALTFCIHLVLSSRMLDSYGSVAFSLQALQSMRSAILGCVQASLLIPFSGFKDLALQSGLLSPEMNTAAPPLIFAAITIAFYVMNGALIHFLLLQPRGRHTRNWIFSLPVILTSLIILESSLTGFMTADKASRFSLPWIGTIQPSFPTMQVFIALLNWGGILIYILTMMLPVRDERMPWQQQSEPEQPPATRLY